MAGRGPAPKGNRTRDRDTPEFETVQAPAGSFHPLPSDLLKDGDEWHPATLRWWETWAVSPLAKDLPAVDWCELEACAVLHHEFMKKRTFTLASELRLRVAKFGATPEDRMRLKVKIETPGTPTATPVQPDGVTDIASRRSRLTDSA